MRSIDDNVLRSVKATLESGHLSRYDPRQSGESDVSRFEREFATVIGSKYAIAVNSCSSGLFLALVASGVQPGDEVLIPAFSFIAVPSAVVHCGATPVLVENTEDYGIDADDLELKITRRTKCLLLTYMRGNIPDLDRVLEVCKRRDVPVIEDCAHSLGILWNGIPMGRFGVAAAYSFQSSKLLDCGEGGIVVMDDKEVAFRTMVLSGCWEDNWRRHPGTRGEDEALRVLTNALPAYGLRMSNLAAAALIPQVDRIEDRVRHHNENYQRLASILSSSNHVRLPTRNPKVRPVGDSMQFELVGLSSGQIKRFASLAAIRGTRVGIFGLSSKNAHCYWHWTFFKPNECPRTRSLLCRTADVRLRLDFDRTDVENIGEIVLDCLDAVS